MSRPSEKPSRLPDQERTAIMLSAGFQEVEAIAAERRLKPKQIAFEYANRLIYKLWDLDETPGDSSRGHYRGVVLSYMSSVVDRELDGWGHAQSQTAAPVRDTVRQALAAAQAAAKDGAAADVVEDGEVWAVIQIVAENKDLIRVLAANVVGSFNPLDCTYVVSGADLVEGLPDHVPSHLKVIKAFLAPLWAQGFVVGLRTVTSSEEP